MKKNYMALPTICLCIFGLICGAQQQQKIPTVEQIQLNECTQAKNQYIEAMLANAKISQTYADTAKMYHSLRDSLNTAKVKK